MLFVSCLVSLVLPYCAAYLHSKVFSVGLLTREQSRFRPAYTSEMQSTATSAEYGSESITVLKGLEPVRKRSGMYIGNTGPRGLHHLVFEIVDNSVDEALAGHCTEISVTLNADGSVEVQDNGRGIPCAIHPSTGKSSLETVLCVLHAGGKFGGDASGYKVSGGLHGVGLSVVNALSDSLVVEVVRDGKFHTMQFCRGVPVGEMQERPATATERRGTKVRFTPDPSIFKTSLVYEFDKLASRLDELAYLNAGLVIHLTDRRPRALQQQAAPLWPGTPGAEVEGAGEAGDSEGRSDEPSQQAGHKVLLAPVGQEQGSAGVGVVGGGCMEDSTRTVTFRHEGGIRELVQTLCAGKSPLLLAEGSTTGGGGKAGRSAAASGTGGDGTTESAEGSPSAGTADGTKAGESHFRSICYVALLWLRCHPCTAYVRCRGGGDLH